MKRFWVVAIVATIAIVQAHAADYAAPVTSTAPMQMVPASTQTIVPVAISSPTLIDAGETISTPTPHAMTDTTGTAPFVTLTRQPLSVDALPSNTDILRPEQARTFDAQNAGEAMFHQTGVAILPQNAPSYPLQARIRGGSPNQTLVLVDGRPMEGFALGAADLSEISLSQIDRIETVRGGLSSLYGPNALGGVINIITKRASQPGYPASHVSYESASFSRQTYKLDFGSRMGPMDYFFFGDQQWQSGFRSNSDNSQYNIGGNAGLSMGKAGKVLVDGASYHNNAGIPGFRCDDLVDPSCLTSTTPLAPNQFNNKDEKPARTPQARKITDSSSLRASYLVDLPHDLFLAARLFGQQREVDLDNSLDPLPANALSTDRRERTKGGDLQLQLPLGFLVGGSFLQDRENVADRLVPSNSFSASAENWGLFAQETFQWESLRLIPSGRFDHNSQFGDTANPNVQALWEAAEWLHVSASAGRSFRAPTIDEAHVNPLLLPEKAWTYEAGFETHESSRSAKINFFRANVGDEIQSSSFTASNVQSARRQGIELQTDHVFNDYFSDGWNYTYLENVGVPSGFDHQVDLAFSPRHTVNFHAKITPTKRWEINPVARWESERFSGNDQTGTKMGSQFTMDLRIAYQWRQMELFFGIKDLLDRRYVEVPGYPLAGRTAYGGVQLRLWG